MDFLQKDLVVRNFHRIFVKSNERKKLKISLNFLIRKKYKNSETKIWWLEIFTVYL